MGTIEEAEAQIDRARYRNAANYLDELGLVELETDHNRLFKQSEVDEIATRVRNSITTAWDGDEKMYSFEDVLRIVQAIMDNPKHKERPFNPRRG